jgi:hypothetical protein
LKPHEQEADCVVLAQNIVRKIRLWQQFATDIVIEIADKWRAQRRAGQQILSPQACRGHLVVQQAEGVQLMYDVLSDPDVRKIL